MVTADSGAEEVKAACATATGRAPVVVREGEEAWSADVAPTEKGRDWEEEECGGEAGHVSAVRGSREVLGAVAVCVEGGRVVEGHGKGEDLEEVDVSYEAGEEEMVDREGEVAQAPAEGRGALAAVHLMEGDEEVEGVRENFVVDILEAGHEWEAVDEEKVRAAAVYQEDEKPEEVNL